LVSAVTAYSMSQVAKLAMDVEASIVQMIGGCISEIWHAAEDHGGHNNDTHHAIVMPVDIRTA